jgi:hypothetical protein
MIVIASDEVAAATEESRDPYTGRFLDAFSLIGVLRLRVRPTRKRSGSEVLCGRFAQDDSR